MWPLKCRWTGTIEPGPERGPLGKDESPNDGAERRLPARLRTGVQVSGLGRREGEMQTRMSMGRRSLKNVSLEAVLGKTRRTEF
jgi:hypothetical protein